MLKSLVIVPQDAEAVKKLSRSDRDDLKEKINSADPHNIFTAAGDSRDPDKRKINCPICGNGTGSDGTPVEVTRKGNVWLYNCFRDCGFQGDLLKIIGSERNLNLNDFNDFCEALAVGAKLIGYHLPDVENSADKPRIIRRASDEDQLPLIKADITDAQNHIADLPESQRRGLTLETLQYFKCGFMPKWIHPKIRIEGKNVSPSRRIIIAAGDHYNAVALPADRLGMKKAFHKMHAGKMELFNPDALNMPVDAPVVVVEGEFDAMSIWQASGGKIAVCAVLGVKNWKVTLAPYLKTCADKKFLILFDGTDKSNAGRKAAERLKAELLQRNILATCKFLDDYLTDAEKKSFGDKTIDANQILQTRGDQFLNDLMTKILEETRADFQTLEEKIAKSATQTDDLSLTAEQCVFLFNGKLTDRQNGDRIAYLFGDRFKFVTNLNQWITFGNGVWTPSEETHSAIYPFARSLQSRIFANAQDAEERKFGAVFDSAKNLDAAIRTLRGHPDIRITSKDLDTHKNLLNCKNGVVDLQTGKLYDAKPELLITRQANAIYRPNYHNEIVEKFLCDIMPNEGDRAALIRWLGYCLTAEIYEQCAFFWTGDGSNGKSTLLELILNLMGNYATKLSVKAVVESKETDANATTTHLNVLAGARLAVVNEFKPYHRLDVQRFKDLTGDSSLDIRRLHKEREIIDMTAKLTLNGNELPKLDNYASYALQRRIRALRFTQTFSAERGNLDMKLSKKLSSIDALSGMLTLCVDAAQAWYQDGLLETDSMKKAKDNYLGENDFIEDFISEYCIFCEDATIKRKDFEARLKQEFPIETLSSRIRPRDLSKLIAQKLESHGAKLNSNNHSKVYEFKGVGWLGAQRQQSLDVKNPPQSSDDYARNHDDVFSGEPIDPNDTPF